MKTPALTRRDLYILAGVLVVLAVALLKLKLLDLSPEQHQEMRKTLLTGAGLLGMVFWGVRFLGGPWKLALAVGIAAAAAVGAVGLTSRLLTPARIKCGPGCGYDPVSDYCLCIGG